MPLTLNTAKPGTEKPKLRLSTKKGDKFKLVLRWDSAHDVDTHALLARNNGGGAKVDAFEQVLSTYNCSSTNPEGKLPPNPDRSFNTPEGALWHSPDRTNGAGNGDDPDEIIVVDGSKVPDGFNEIPIFITIHPSSQPATFGEVRDASIQILDESGKELGHYKLSTEFASFSGVQMGSLILGTNGWEYVAVGTGFMGDINNILEFFS